jgi:hypothetical protein
LGSEIILKLFSKIQFVINGKHTASVLQTPPVSVLFGGVIAPYSVNSLCKKVDAKSAEFLVFKLGGNHNSHCALKGCGLWIYF